MADPDRPTLLEAFEAGKTLQQFMKGHVFDARDVGRFWAVWDLPKWLADLGTEYDRQVNWTGTLDHGLVIAHKVIRDYLAASEAAPASLRKLLEDLRPLAHAGINDPLWLHEKRDALLARVDAALVAPVVSAWTTEPPKVAGWYWWRGKRVVRAVQVGARPGRGLAVKVPERSGFTTPELAGGEWQGPIEPK